MIAAVRSYRIICQHFLKKWLVKPSEPGACFVASDISPAISLPRRKVYPVTIGLPLGDQDRTRRSLVYGGGALMIFSMFIVVVEDPARFLTEALYEVFPVSTICPEMEEASICVTLVDIPNLDALFIHILVEFLIHRFRCYAFGNTSAPEWPVTPEFSRNGMLPALVGFSNRPTSHIRI